jgi:hypothetical protein
MTDTYPTKAVLQARGKAAAFADDALLAHYNADNRYHVQSALKTLAALEATIPAARAALEALQKPSVEAAVRRAMEMNAELPAADRAVLHVKGMIA